MKVLLIFTGLGRTSFTCFEDTPTTLTLGIAFGSTLVEPKGYGRRRMEMSKEEITI
jgi:hypothetical protein